MNVRQVNIIKPYKIRVKKTPEPRSSNPYLPPFYYNALFIGMTGSGKSYSFVSLLKLYEKYGIYDYLGHKMDMRIVLISPTINSTANTVLSLLKIDEEDQIAFYTEDILEEKINELIEEQEGLREWNKYVEAYKKFHKFNDADTMTDEELELLDKYNGFESDEVPKRKTEKVYFIIFDDMLGTGAFGTKRKSKLNNLIILCRHHHINIFITAQHLRSIPPIIRSNVRVFVIFKSNNYKKLLDNVYQEISGIINQDKFEELYHFATQSLHDSLVVIIHNDLEPKYRIRKGWTDYLEYE
jgi:Poxvirus A32 protein